VTFTEIATPLPNIPVSELLNPVPNSTLASHPHLFKIVTPVNVDKLEQLLVSHPNRPLVKSVCCGFHDGFWPFAHFDDTAPDMWDNSACALKGTNLDFALKQCDEEVQAG